MQWGGPEQPGPVALVGSGEYSPGMQIVESLLLQGRAPRFAQLATAAAPEGPHSLERWHALGRASAERLGVEAVIVPVVDRASADDPALADLVEGAGLVYLSGGDPRFLAETLRATAVWRAIEATWRAGAALAGCSAGAMVLAAAVPDVRNPLRGSAPGLSVVPGVQVVPHFDRFVKRLPTPLLRAAVRPTRGVQLIGVDEDTALVGGPTRWRVMGAGSAWLLHGDERVEYPSGAALEV